MQISAEYLVQSKNINSHVCVVDQSSCKLIDGYLQHVCASEGTQCKLQMSFHIPVVLEPLEE